MKVFLTGATGFVGAHTAMALLDAGHQLRLLVRNQAFAQQYFADHGYHVDDFVVADMREKDTIRQSLHGCDVVIHAAALVSLDPKRAQEIYQNNIDGIDAVIGSAIAAGINNIIYVSSLGALFNPAVASIDEHSPLGNPKEAYSRSKRDCDAYVRKLQHQGAPIQITYPSGIFGPDDPRLTESNHALITFLDSVVPRTSSGIQCVDVRDLAKVHVYLAEHPVTAGFEQARYIVAGHFYTWGEFHQLLQNITGRRIFSPRIPGWLLRICGSVMDVVKKIYPVNMPVTSESMAIVTQWSIADSGKILQTANMQFRSGEQTFSDTARWLAKAGHLDNKYIGKLAES